MNMNLHKGEKPFQCSDCGKPFSRKSYLTIHKRTHTERKPFQGLKSSKASSQPNHLRAHMQPHTAEGPFQYSECNQSFSHSNQLVKHLRTQTGKKPFQCSECGKFFSRNSYLEIHARTHPRERLFQCSICSKTFKQKSHHKDHIKMHSGERPFECSECSKLFPQNSPLKANMGKHTGVMPYQCSVGIESEYRKLKNEVQMDSRENYECSKCEVTYTSEEALNEHLEMHSIESIVCNASSVGNLCHNDQTPQSSCHSESNSLQSSMFKVEPHSYVTNGNDVSNLGILDIDEINLLHKNQSTDVVSLSEDPLTVETFTDPCIKPEFYEEDYIDIKEESL